MAHRSNRVSPSSLAPRTELIVEPCKDDPGKPEDCGNWYWALKVDGGIHSDGEAENRMIAQSRAVAAYDDWLEQQ